MMSRRGIEASQLSSQELAALGGDVDMVLERGFRGLRFPPRLEEAFERETGEARTRYLVASGVVALVIYDLFLITDRMMIPDVFGTALIVRLAILTPIALLTFLAVWRGLRLSSGKAWRRRSPCWQDFRSCICS